MPTLSSFVPSLPNPFRRSPPPPVQPASSFMELLDATIANAPPELAKNASYIRSQVLLSQVAPEHESINALVSLGSMLNKAMVSHGTTVGINEFGALGRRQYVSDRRRLLELYRVVEACSELQSAIHNLRNEIFRRGLYWEPAFDYKCDECEQDYTASEAKKLHYRCYCTAGLLDHDQNAPRLRAPNPQELTAIDKFFKRVNYFGQSLEAVLRVNEKDIDTVDDAFLFIRKTYWRTDEEELIARQSPLTAPPPNFKITDILRLDPTIIQFDSNDRGRPGFSHHVCLFHRETLLDIPQDQHWDIEWKGICPQCGERTYPVFYTYNEQAAAPYSSSRPVTIYLLEDEILHWSRHSACYDDQTDVLTRDGWKRFAEITPETEIATLGFGGMLTWERPESIIADDYHGPMWVAKSNYVDLCVTPNHSLYVQEIHKHGCRNYHEHDRYPRHPVYLTDHSHLPQGPKVDQTHGPFAAHQAQYMNAASLKMLASVSYDAEDVKTFTIPGYESASTLGKYHPRRSGPLPPLTVSMDDWLVLLGYYLAEGTKVPASPLTKNGHRSGSRSVQITQSKQKNQANIQHLEEVLTRMGLHWTNSAGNDKIEIWHPGLREYCRQFGGADDKFVPREFMNLSRRQCLILLNALMAGDGHWAHIKENGSTTAGGSVYTSKSKRLLNDVQELALKCGYTASVATDTQTALRSGIGRVYIRRGQRGTQPEVKEGGYGLSEQVYHGKVYCCTVPGHVMLVRRNGKAVWSGNSETYGWPPIFSLFEKALTLLGMDRFIYDYFFERRIPQGVVAVNTSDVDGVRMQKAQNEQEMMRNPHYIPWIAVNPANGQGGMQYIRFGYTLDELDYLPVRDEIRERISMVYGVSNVWMNAGDPAGGLNNQSLEITVTSRVVETAQRSYKVDVFEKLERLLGVKDWHLSLKHPEESSELATLEVKQAKAQWAATMQGMGFGLDYDEETDEYHISGRVPGLQEQIQQQSQMASIGNGGSMMPQPAPQPSGARDPSHNNLYAQGPVHSSTQNQRTHFPNGAVKPFELR